jgi:hypothetical protein
MQGQLDHVPLLMNEYYFYYQFYLSIYLYTIQLINYLYYVITF